MTNRKAYLHQWYAENKAECERLGICVKCRKRDVRPNTKCCPVCTADMAVRGMARYYKHIDAGICGRCKELAVPNRSLCEKHLAEGRARYWKKKRGAA